MEKRSEAARAESKALSLFFPIQFSRSANAPAYQQIRNAIELQLNRLLELCQHEKKRWRTLKKYSKEELQEYLATLED